MDELEIIKKELADKEALFLEAEVTIKACYAMENRMQEKRWNIERAKDTLGDKIGAIRRRILEIVTHS